MKRSVTGWIPGGITGIFHGHNSSGRTMTKGSPQPPTKISISNISLGGGGCGGCKGGQCVGLPTLPTLCADGLEIWEPKTPEILKTFRHQSSDCFAFSIKVATASRRISRL